MLVVSIVYQFPILNLVHTIKTRQPTPAEPQESEV